MEKLITQVQKLKNKQNELMTQMSKEKCKDIHSVLRSKALAESIIELEVKLEVLKDAIVSVA
jgi:seryl-tRNA synthetase